VAQGTTRAARGSGSEANPSLHLEAREGLASFERTLPEIRADQLKAAVLVASYAAKCVRQLIAERFSGANASRELEKRILATVAMAARHMTTKRRLYRALARHFKNSEQFNRVFDSMVRAGILYTRLGDHGRVYVSTEPFTAR
jgi:hypothetical protein